MITRIINTLFSGNTENLCIRRNFSPQYLISDKHHEEYCRKGFTVIRNCISAEHIERINHLYEKISQMEGFHLDKEFLNSGRLESSEIRNIVMDEIKSTSKEILKGIANTDNCIIECGGSLLIKPPSKESALNPHQDTPIVDETKYYATYLWIPLCDMTSQNGTLSVLPGSHLWGNHQRSLNIPWIYTKYTNFIWKYMEPIYVNRGDIILFDSATIHASTANLSDKIRLAYATTILPKDYQIIHYYKGKEVEKDKVEKISVDEDFFRNYNIMEHPPKKYTDITTEEWIGKEPVTYTKMFRLLSATQNI